MVEINGLKIISANVKCDNNEIIKVSGIYRGLKINKKEILKNIEEFLIMNKTY